MKTTYWAWTTNAGRYVYESEQPPIGYVNATRRATGETHEAAVAALLATPREPVNLYQQTGDYSGD